MEISSIHAIRLRITKIRRQRDEVWRKAPKAAQGQPSDAGGAGEARRSGTENITNYEKGTTYPQDRRVYGVLAEILGTSADYLHNENDDFVSMAGKEFGYRGRVGAEKLVGELTGLFAGGEMAEEDMDELMLAIQEAYVDAKRRNKKYAPKKYQQQP